MSMFAELLHPVDTTCIHSGSWSDCSGGQVLASFEGDGGNYLRHVLAHKLASTKAT